MKRTNPRRPFLIGLLGGVASGKSQVAALLAKRGAVALDADELAHRELQRPVVRQAVEEAFGKDVLDPDGSVDRAALASRVFADREALQRLEAIVHPGVIEAIRNAIDRLEAPGSGPRPVAVLDVPLIAEAGLAELCDERLFVDTRSETREARARARGWAPGEVARREARQQPLEEKRRVATFVIDNDGDLARMADEVERFWRERVIPRLST